MSHVLTLESIGTHWHIEIFDEIDDATWMEIVREIHDMMQVFESSYSRFIPDSFIGLLNSEKTVQNFPQEMYDLISYANHITELTKGSFNIAVGTHLENLGYDTKYSFINKNKKVEIKNLDWLIDFTPNQIQISPEVTLDLGGLGKGWLIDKIRDYFLSKNINYFLINGGGDIYFTSKEGETKKFALESPFGENEMIGTINIRNAAIACSSPVRRTWLDTENRRNLHHLIDANSGENNPDIASVFTYGENSLQTDIGSTAIFISEPSLVKSIAEKLNINFLVIFSDGNYFKSPGYPGVMNEKIN